MKAHNTEVIGQRLHLVLEQSGVSPAQLARRANVPRSRVGQWLKGANLTMPALAIIAEQLDVSLNWLVLGHGEQEPLSQIKTSVAERQLIRSLRHIRVDAEPINQIVSRLNDYSRRSPSLDQSSGAYPMLYSGNLGWVRISPVGVMLDVNAAMIEMLGAKSAKQLIGHSGFDFICKEYHHRVQQAMRLVLSRGYDDYSHLKIIPLNTNESVSVITKACLKEVEGSSVIEVMVKPLDRSHYGG